MSEVFIGADIVRLGQQSLDDASRRVWAVRARASEPFPPPAPRKARASCPRPVGSDVCQVCVRVLVRSRVSIWRPKSTSVYGATKRPRAVRSPPASRMHRNRPNRHSLDARASSGSPAPSQKAANPRRFITHEIARHHHHLHLPPPRLTWLQHELFHPHGLRAPQSFALHALEVALIVGGALAVLLLLARVVGRHAEHRATERGARFELRLPHEFDRAALGQVFQSLTVLLRQRLFGRSPWIGFALVAEENRARIEVFCSGGVPAAQVRTTLEEALPGASVDPCPGVRLSGPPGVASACALVPADAVCLPFETDHAIDPARLVLAGLVAGAAGEGGLVQLLLRPASGSARRRAWSRAGRLRTGRTHSHRFELAGAVGRFLVGVFEFVVELVGEIVSVFLPGGSSPSAPSSGRAHSPASVHQSDPWALERARLLEQKAAQPLLAAWLRLVAFAPDKRRARERLRGLVAGFAPLEARGRLRRGHELWFWSRLHRWLVPLRAKLVLTPAEAAAFLPLPDPEATGSLSLVEAPARRLPPATEAPSKGLLLGRTDREGFATELRISTDALLQHAHVLGPTGRGKSTLLLTVALEAINGGLGLVLIEPKGDLTQWVLERIPAQRIADVELLDLGDEDHPPALNLLACRPEDADLHAEALTAIFRRLFTRFWGPRSEDILRAALGTLLSARADGPDPPTLADVLDLLTFPAQRGRFVVRDPVALERFWRQWDELSAAQREQALAPLSNKLRAFLYRGQLRRVLCQPGAPSFERIVAERKIVLCPLPVGRLGRDGASLIGSVITYRLWQAAQRLGPAKERAPFLCMVDEFHQFCHLPQGMSEALAEARGYGLGFVLAHQHLGQLNDRDLVEAVEANCQTKICFALSPNDSHKMVGHFAPRLDERDLQYLGAYRIACRIAHEGRQLPAATAATLPAPPPDAGPPEAWIRRRMRAKGKTREEVEAMIEERYRRAEAPKEGSATADDPSPPGSPPGPPPDGGGSDGDGPDDGGDSGGWDDPDEDAA